MKNLLIIIAAVALLTACGSGGSKKNANQQKAATTTEQVHQHFVVNGSCNMCKDRIEKTAKSIDGVSSAQWDAETQQIHVNFDGSKTSVDAISKALAKVGHDTEKHKADQATYDALPGCCKYRK